LALLFIACSGSSDPDASNDPGGGSAASPPGVESNVLETPTCDAGTFALRYHADGGIQTARFEIQDVTKTDDSLDADLNGGDELHLTWEPGWNNGQDAEFASGWLRVAPTSGLDSDIGCVDPSLIEIDGSSASIDFALLERDCYEPPETEPGEPPPAPPPSPPARNMLGCFAL